MIAQLKSLHVGDDPAVFGLYSVAKYRRNNWVLFDNTQRVLASGRLEDVVSKLQKLLNKQEGTK